jgi:pilus assembly protein CpaB
VRGLEHSAKDAETADRPNLPRVVVALAPIEQGKSLRADALSLEVVSIVPEGSFQKIEDVVGRKVYQPVGQGEALLSRHFRPPGPVASRIKPGERAIAVKVDGVIGLGGFIQPDDRVDVLLYLARDQREIADTQARVLLEDIRVLAYGANLERQEKSEKDDNTNNARTAVLAGARRRRRSLMLGASKGSLRLALRGDPGRRRSRTGRRPHAATSTRA